MPKSIFSYDYFSAHVLPQIPHAIHSAFSMVADVDFILNIYIDVIVKLHEPFNIHHLLDSETCQDMQEVGLVHWSKMDTSIKGQI